MKNNVTELVFIFDRSGSMSGLEGDTIGGFNSMIEKQKRQEGECYVSTVLFDDESQVLHDRVRLGDVPKMTEDDYTVRGCTALIDAIGGAIHHIGNIHKYARPRGRARAYDVCDHYRRMRECKPQIYKGPCEENDRETEGEIRLGVSLYRSKH